MDGWFGRFGHERCRSTEVHEELKQDDLDRREREREREQETRTEYGNEGDLHREIILHPFGEVIEDPPTLKDPPADSREIIIGKDNIGCFLCSIGSFDAHGNPDISPSECKSIIHTVTGDCNHFPVFLKRLHEPVFVFREGPGKDGNVLHHLAKFFIGKRIEFLCIHNPVGDDPDLSSNSSCSPGVITRHHNRADPCPLSQSYRLPDPCPRRIFDGNQSPEYEVLLTIFKGYVTVGRHKHLPGNRNDTSSPGGFPGERVLCPPDVPGHIAKHLLRCADHKEFPAAVPFPDNRPGLPAIAE